MTALNSLLVHTTYTTTVLSLIGLCVWSIVHTWTKLPTQPVFTEMHMTLTNVVGAGVLILLVALIHRHAKSAK